MVKKLKLILGIIIGFLISSTGLTGKTELVHAEEITINGTNFPDEVFRNYISVNFDINKNNILSDTEINEVKQINVSSTNLNYKEIYNLQGIAYFTNLEVLDCSDNKLISLDLSKNIKLIEVYCENNQLANLDTGDNTTLTVLNCEYNQIMELDLAKNSSLEKLYCAENQLINLNLSKNYYLTTLSCGHNPLAVLELSTRTISRLKLSITSLHDFRANSTIISNLVNIAEIDGIFQIIDINKPATYKYSNDKYSGDFTLIYVQADEFISLDNFVNANCEHLFYDYNYTDVVSGSPIVIYGNGGTFKTGGIKTTNKKFTAYTDILASYTCTINNKGIVKPVTGKVIVGITTSSARPFIAKNKIIDKEAAKIAKARIKNGQVTVTATGKEGGVVYLWIIDTGDKGKYEYCPINVKLAPRKLQVRDEGRDIIKNPVVFNGEEIKVFITGTVSKYKEASNCTYTAEVAVNSQNYIKVTPYGDFGNQFEIKVIGFQSNKKTKASVNFICRENGKKVKFSMTILPYG